ncbi:MAG: hypothetical protein AAGA56_15695, partial [Myxococcota bacterium]
MIVCTTLLSVGGCHLIGGASDLTFDDSPIGPGLGGTTGAGGAPDGSDGTGGAGGDPTPVDLVVYPIRSTDSSVSQLFATRVDGTEQPRPLSPTGQVLGRFRLTPDAERVVFTAAPAPS